MDCTERIPTMKPSRRAILRITLATIFFALGSPFAWCEAPEPGGPGWKPLFKPDLSDARKPEGVWTVKDGVITASQDQCLWTKDEYSDFLLDLEFKTAPGTNSGVILYCKDTKNWVPAAVEIQIADDYAEKWAKSPPSFHCGAIFGHVPPSARLVKPPGEWNRMTIQAKGQHIKVWLNGALASEMDMSKWTSAKTNPDGTAIPPWLKVPLAEVPVTGRIGFQGKHGDAPIWFRDIRIKPLSE